MGVNKHERLFNNTLVQLSLSIYLFAKYNKQGYNNNTLVNEQRVVRKVTDVNKGNNKIIRTPNSLTKGKSKLISIQTDKISQQPENCENRNDPDLVQAFLKKWWVESDFKAPNLPLSLRLKVFGCHYAQKRLSNITLRQKLK